MQKFLRKFFFPKRYLMYKCKSYYNHCGRSRIQVKKKIIKKKKKLKKKKIHLWAKFHIWVQKFLHSQKNLKNANLRYKLLSVTYNNILRSIPLKFDIFTKILDENLTFFFQALGPKRVKGTFWGKKKGYGTFFCKHLHIGPTHHKNYGSPLNSQKVIKMQNGPFRFGYN